MVAATLTNKDEVTGKKNPPRWLSDRMSPGRLPNQENHPSLTITPTTIAPIPSQISKLPARIRPSALSRVQYLPRRRGRWRFRPRDRPGIFGAPIPTPKKRRQQPRRSR